MNQNRIFSLTLLGGSTVACKCAPSLNCSAVAHFGNYQPNKAYSAYVTSCIDSTRCKLPLPRTTLLVGTLQADTILKRFCIVEQTFARKQLSSFLSSGNTSISYSACGTILFPTIPSYYTWRQPSLGGCSTTQGFDVWTYAWRRPNQPTANANAPYSGNESGSSATEQNVVDDTADSSIPTFETGEESTSAHSTRMDGQAYHFAAERLHILYEKDPQGILDVLHNLERNARINLKENPTFEPSDSIQPPTFGQLQLLALSSSIPFVGFGFVDNFVMIVAGDMFDTTLCVICGFSTMAAAALGNLISDVLGVGLSGYIDKLAFTLGFPQPKLTPQQLRLPVCRRWYYSGSAIGVAIGCFLGMSPLLFIDAEEGAQRKRLKAKEELFGDVMQEMAGFMRAEKAILYLVDKQNNNFRTTISEIEWTLPLDAGIPGEAYATGKLINWHPTHNEKTRTANFPQETSTTKFPTDELTTVTEKKAARQILGAPVFGVTGEIIGVVEVVNPVGKEVFTRKDKEFLIAICSHLAVEIEGKHHINNILRMCRKQVGSRRAKPTDSNKGSTEESVAPPLVEPPWDVQSLGDKK
ncbi:hypothetical protein IE077_001634 [Cardiosporidium cionae]|uniref:GAF domain-containing protein n=1 Tax=Cardiosporidium cionae TaxID=476202 RepID=A0ABQ7JCR5_9APIC|nr:hypothetical protein IE077_001634 [Cardiosporidium cionae]|eukprot:KAF8821749.1 hypothetical protein IE077_001634 [Cardiosporidium cionae]